MPNFASTRSLRLLAALIACLACGMVPGGARAEVQPSRLLTPQNAADLFAALKSAAPELRLLGLHAEGERVQVDLCQDASGWCGGIGIVRRDAGCEAFEAGAWCLMPDAGPLPAGVGTALVAAVGQVPAGPGVVVRAGPGPGAASGQRTVQCGLLDGRCWLSRARSGLFSMLAPDSLLAPLVPGDQIAPGWTLERVAPEDVALRVVLSGPGGLLLLTIEDRFQTGLEDVACQVVSRSFCMRVDERGADWILGDTEAREAVQAVGRALVRNDAFSPFDMLMSGFLWRALLLAVFLIGLAGAVATGVRAWRSAPLPGGVLLALVGVTVVAGLLRWQLSPWTFLHEYFHVAHRLSALYREPLLVYGEAGPILFRAVHWLTGLGPRSIFLADWAIATLTVPALACLDHALFGRWPRAILSALFLAFLPQHLRFSASEVLSVAGTFFLVSGLALTVRFLRTFDGWSLVGAIAWLFLATQSRPELIHAPLLALLLVPVVRPGETTQVVFRPGVLAGAAGLLIGIAAGRVLAGMLPGALPALPSSKALHLTWFSVEWTPLFLIGASFLGLAAGLRQRWRIAVWLGIGFLGAGLLPLAFFSNTIYNLRTQLPALPFAVLLASWGATWLARRSSPRRTVRIAAIAGLVLLACVGLIQRLDLVTGTRAVQQEWAFLQRAVPLLPDGPGAVVIGSRHVGAALPEDLLWHQGKLLQVQDIGTFLASGSREAAIPRPLFHLGMYCYLRPIEVRDSPRRLRSECERVLGEHFLEPLVVESLPGPLDPDSDNAAARGPFPVGFFRIAGPKFHGP